MVASGVMPQMLLRITEAAQIAGISRGMVYELIRSGQLPIVKIGRATRIPAAALEGWIKRHTYYREEAA